MLDAFSMVPYAGQIVAGVDEVGRGPLAGPVVAAAVVLDDAAPIDGLADSKKLSEKKRETLAAQIKATASSYAIIFIEPTVIDEINILQASLLAMQRAVLALKIQPVHALVDGNHAPELPMPVTTVIKGDARVAAISAASIIAKVARDQYMCECDLRYPGYGFAGHKGYPTKSHVAALHEHGVTPLHRRSYAPVRQALEAVGEYCA